MTELIVLYRMPNDPEHFEKYYREVHGPMTSKLPGLKGYKYGPARALDGGTSEFFWYWCGTFDSAQAALDAMASPEGQAGAADVPKYYHEDPLFMFFENFGTNREAASVALTPQTTTKGLPIPLKVNALDHIVVNVADVARTVDWYQKVLGMEVRVFDPGHGKPVRTSLVFGHQKINVRPLGADKVEWFTADHETPGSDYLCFLTSSTPEQVVVHLRACGVMIEKGPVTKQGARGALRSVYCRDPDGSLIEISSYEK